MARPGSLRYSRGDRYAQARELGYLLNFLAFDQKQVLPATLLFMLRFIPRRVVRRELLWPFVVRPRIAAGEPAARAALLPDSPECSLAQAWNDPRSHGRLQAAAVRLLTQARRRLRPGAGSGLAARAREVKETFRLRAAELECLLFIYLLASGELAGLLPEAAVSNCEPFRVRQRLHGIAVGTGLAPGQVMAIMAEQARLRRYGLLDGDLDLNPHLVTFLSGLTRDPLTSTFYREYRGPTLPLASHATVTRQLDVLCRLIRSRRPSEGLHLLFYGAPGTGKTELARSLAAALGYRLFGIRHIGDDRSTSRFRFAALNACLNTVDTARSLILVDEADDVLNTAAALLNALLGQRSPTRGDKGLLNDLMDNARAVCLWIVNRADGIDESTRRRFDYSVEFPEFTLKQRLLMWAHCLRKHRLAGRFTPAEVQHLARAYRVNTGGIDIALRDCRRLVAGGTTPRQAVEQLLTQQVRLMAPGRGSAMPALTDRYTLDGLSIRSEPPLAECLQALRGFSQCLAAQAEAAAPPGHNCNLLLHGPPGTGKTEFAKYVAHELGRELLVKRGSDLLDMYVGQTEKAIQAAFRQAEAAGAVLLLDEIDGLLGSRQGAVHSWEITRVNELLVDMEGFRGILICATNRRAHLDPAALRRFTFKVEFGYLDGAGKRLFFDRLLQGLTNAAPTPPELAALDRLEPLAPGDFKVVGQQFRFSPPERRSNRRLIEALAAEARGRTGTGAERRIGF